ncbi:MAG: hypothetical protein MUQ32_08665 [Chloroflexi bacterium]|nr:hypothetical protein [Chloroflexota bacterium]
MDRPPDLEHSKPVPAEDASVEDASVDDARRRLREQGIVAVEPDERIGVMLAPGERVVAVRHAIAMERRKEVRDPELALRGDLYVTTTRLVCLGQVPVDVPLVEISEAIVAAGALRLIVGDGRGVEIRTGDPYLLRVEVSAAREAARQAAGPRPSGDARQITAPGTAES